MRLLVEDQRTLSVLKNIGQELKFIRRDAKKFYTDVREEFGARPKGTLLDPVKVLLELIPPVPPP